MSFEGDDTRKVQTAVVGRAESDWPVFLPYDHDDFDSFMRGRTRDDFYCGTLLGGCGKKLTAKRYLGKKCHFAHRPPVHCRRTARTSRAPTTYTSGKRSGTGSNDRSITASRSRTQTWGPVPAGSSMSGSAPDTGSSGCRWHANLPKAGKKPEHV